MMTDTDRDSMTIEEAASALGVTRATLYEWLRSGGYSGYQLRTVKVGKARMLARADVLRIRDARAGKGLFGEKETE